jgi:hypothetical protein
MLDAVKKGKKFGTGLCRPDRNGVKAGTFDQPDRAGRFIRLSSPEVGDDRYRRQATISQGLAEPIQIQRSALGSGGLPIRGTPLIELGKLQRPPASAAVTGFL